MSRRAIWVRLCRASCVLVAITALPVLAFAQRPTNIPPGECTNCHDHDEQKEWSVSRDGDGKGKQHFKAYQQLFEPKGLEYGEALGVKVNDVKAPCLACHGTTVQGKAKNGVTCQTCHGPGSLYNKPHQAKGAYQEAVKLGLKDTVKNPKAWVQDCIGCHVMGANPDDARIVKAGHSDGADFVIGTRLQFVSGPGHWKSTYQQNDINAIAEPLKRVLIARLKGSGSSTTTTTAAGGGSPVIPPVIPPVGPPVTTTVTPPPVNKVETTTPTGGGTAPPPPVNVPVVRPSAPTAQELAAPPPPIPRPQPLPRPAPAAVTETAVQPPPPEAPATPATMVGSIQGRLAALLDSLLLRGVVLPKPVTPPQKKSVYRGADAELIRLQDEIISLALDALASPPANAKPRTQQ